MNNPKVALDADSVIGGLIAAITMSSKTHPERVFSLLVSGFGYLSDRDPCALGGMLKTMMQDVENDPVLNANFDNYIHWLIDRGEVVPLEPKMNDRSGEDRD